VDGTTSKFIERLEPQDLRAHLYLLGGGAWRTDLALDLAISLINQGYGVCFLDRSGPASNLLLRAMPPTLIENTFYWNIGDRKRQAALNILNTEHKDERYMAVEMLVMAFQSLFGTDGVGHRSAYLLTNLSLALMDVPGSTLYCLKPLLINSRYRAYIRAQAKSRHVREFWSEFAAFEENPKLLLEITAPLMNKLGALFLNPLVRNIFAQTVSTVDFDFLMKTNKVIIINLAEQSTDPEVTTPIGRRQATLVGNLVLSNLKLAASKRTSHEKDFFLFIPNCETLSQDLLDDFLANTTNRLNLVIGSQSLSHRRETFSRCGSFISFKCSSDDLELIVSELADPRYEQRKLMESLTLSGRRICGRLFDWQGGSFSPAFDGVVEPLEYIEAGKPNSIINYSRMRYARPRAKIERKLSRFAEHWDAKENKSKKESCKPSQSNSPSET
jgi:hypothetical protein